MLGSLLIILVLTIATSAILFGTLTKYNIASEQKELIDEAVRLNELTVYQYSFERGSAAAIIYQMNVDNCSKRINGSVLIFNTSGEMVISSKNSGEYLKNNIYDQKIKKYIDGETHIIIGNFDNVFKSPSLIAMVPLKNSNNLLGVTCLSVPLYQVNKYAYSLFSRFLIWALLAFALASLLSYFISRMISKPINKITKAAKQIAKGDFSVTIDSVGDDEISQLCTTFNNMKNSLEEIENNRSEFISNVSHELRTPMTTISGFIDGILDGTIKEEEQKKYLSIVSDEIKRLSRLVNELLSLTRIDRKQIKLDIKPLDINELIRLKILNFESRLNDAKINVEINFEQDKTIVLADEDAISRVIINLLENAIKFNKENGYIKIDVVSKGGKVFVSVENSGKGLSCEELNKVWDRFYKSDRSRGMDKQGLGLGLYIAHSLVLAHEEEITVQSKQNEFAKFTFSLKKQ